MGTVSLATVSVKTTFSIMYESYYFAKLFVYNFYYVAYHVASHFIALYFICLDVLGIQLGRVANKLVYYYYYYYV